MYFWNIHALKEEIKSGNFGDREAIVYIVVSLFLYYVGFELVYLFPLSGSLNKWDHLDSFLSVIIPVAGTLYAYKKNGGAEGKDFANRYFAISFLMGIRFLVYFMGIMIFLMFYWDHVYGNVDEIPTTWIDVTVYAVWYIALYYQVGRHIEELDDA